MDLSLSIRAIKDLFSFPFRDPEWKSKFLLGCGLNFAALIIPILPLLAVWGYLARLMRAGARNEDAARLPVWDEWGDMLLDGLCQFGVILIFTLPAVIVMFAGWALYMVGVFSMAGVQGNSAEAGGRAIFMMTSMVIMFVCMGIGMVLSIGGWVMMPAAQAHVAVNRRFAAVFDVRGWWQALRLNFGGFIIAAGMFFATLFAIMLVFQILYFTIVLCLFSPLFLFPAGFYALLLVYRLTGQAYGEALEKTNQPEPQPFPPQPGAELPAAAS